MRPPAGAANPFADVMPHSPTMNLFAYGTLMDPDILRVAAGASYEGQPAKLSGYLRKRISDEVYPGIIRRDEASVAGIVYGDVPVDAFRRLDRFEGPLYERTLVAVRDGTSTRRSAYAYVLTPAAASRLSAEDWSFEQFLASGKREFLRTYPRSGRGADTRQKSVYKMR